MYDLIIEICLIDQHRGWQTITVEDQLMYILGFVGHVWSLLQPLPLYSLKYVFGLCPWFLTHSL